MSDYSWEKHTLSGKAKEIIDSGEYNELKIISAQTKTELIIFAEPIKGEPYYHLPQLIGYLLNVMSLITQNRLNEKECAEMALRMHEAQKTRIQTEEIPSKKNEDD